VVEEMGPYNGRWLVEEYSRNLFDLNTTIQLTKAMPSLPEPTPPKGNKTNLRPSWVPKYISPGTNPVQAPQPENPIPDNAPLAVAANSLLQYYKNGWTDDNGRGYQQILDTSQGKTVHSPLGNNVYLDIRIIQVILWLIQDKGLEIGTFAWCADHASYDGPSGHQGGHAVDISSVNGRAIGVPGVVDNSQALFDVTYKCAKLLHDIDLTNTLHPRQLITGGFGNHRDFNLTALTLPAGWADRTDGSGYNPTVMGEHCNHIHVGY
jgi:hypothetical protein